MTTPPSSGTNDRRRDFLRDSLILAGAVPGALAGAVAQSAVPVWQPADQRPLKLAILGCGRRGSQLVRLAGAQAAIPIEIVALGDLFADRVQQLFRSLSGEFPHCAGRQLTTRVSGRSAVRHMADSDADLVVVAAATGCRPEQVEQLIAAGKSVYAERPVATDPVSLLRFADLDSLARRRGVALQVGLQHRHQAFYAETIARIHAGTIGRPRLARIELTGPAVDDPLDAKTALSEANRWRQWRRDPALGGGPLLEALCGSVDLINWSLGARPLQAVCEDLQLPLSVAYLYPDNVRLECRTRVVQSGGWQIRPLIQATEGWCDLSRGRLFDSQNRTLWSAAPERPDPATAVVRLLEVVARHRGSQAEVPLPVEALLGAQATASAMLGQWALSRPRQIVRWDDCLGAVPEARMTPTLLPERARQV